MHANGLFKGTRIKNIAHNTNIMLNRQYMQNVITPVRL